MAVQDDFAHAIKLANPESKIITIGKLRILDFIFFIIRRNWESKKELFILQGVFNLKYIFFDLFLTKRKSILVVPRGDYIPTGNENWKVPNILLKNTLWLTFIKRRLLNSNGVVFTSNIEKSRFLQKGLPDTNLHIIPDAYNLDERFGSNFLAKNFDLNNINTKFILYVGRISPEKNLEFLIELFFNLRNEINSKIDIKCLSLVIVGPISKQNYYISILNKIKFLGLEKHVLFNFTANANDLMNYYKNTELVLLPSYIESFGLTVLESLYFNKKIIVSTNTPWNEFNNSSVIVLPLNLHIWKNNIIDLLTSKNDASENLNFLKQFYPILISAKWSLLFKKLNNEI